MPIMQDSRDADMLGRRTDGSTVRRPLSPHLQVYDMLQMSSAMSIAGRITGVAWSVGVLLLVWWLVAAAAGPRAFAQVQWFLGSWLGLLILVGMTGAAWFHTLNGIRHLAWDAGHGYEIPTMYRSGWTVLIATAVLTVLTWLVAIIAWA
ncbi:succinate dehydrogenase, cytochrome b556 subunit [Siccirubricoccus sp. G192]|uniref:succinate dehydrogenase, cytochrome b556 subunit n=1 Tax=Siccirubricoccus sp. G192 TaxID=2849651 RepID=UPI001C2C78DC|nr:succinate dehydrogenase, cytochrome b556 subunit [Siccirubricoccus sp. G192]MBV1797337.1 succinate dehydrogenase, cytochrome b556 subunit [Siccirubricoccus sp. G192]